MLEIEGTTITADTMSCQKAIVAKITEKGANYALAVKENQRNLYDNIKDYFEMDDPEITMIKTLDKDHGRIESRTFFIRRYRLAVPKK